MKKRLQVVALVAVAVTVILAGCAIFKIFGGGGFKFSHKKHIDEGAECLGCHSQSSDGGKMVMPTLKKCMVCHEGIDPDKPKEKKIAQLFEGENLKTWKSVTAITDDIKFSHKTHIDYKVGCWDCHKGIKENTAISDKLRVSMGDCISCHSQKQVKNGDDCATCHKTIRKDEPPQSHKELWKERHGQLVKLDDGTMDSRCYYCHKENECIRCHHDEPPRNHTNFWRRVGHATVMGIDRENCSTCHQSEFCTKCHQETPPRNHTATWGIPKDAHCLNCHQPLNNTQECSVCHTNTSSHLLAPAKPTWHVAGVNCRTCHVGKNAPKHVDDGVTNCESCHNK